MNSSRRVSKRASTSAPATPRGGGHTDLGEYRLPFMITDQETVKKAKNEQIVVTMSESAMALSPMATKHQPVSTVPLSPASSVCMSPTRKESYKDLITRAISSHPDKLMTLSDIYAWIVANVDVYRDQSHIPSTQGWKNAIRHTLSFYKCFKRVKRHPSIEKPSYWTIDYQEQSTATSATPKPSPLAATPPVPTPVASAVIRPVPTAPGSISSVIKEHVTEERRTQDTCPDLQSLMQSWPIRSDSRSSIEEQCVQGLLLFRTSAGFGFLPQSCSSGAQPSPSTVSKYTTGDGQASLGSSTGSAFTGVQPGPSTHANGVTAAGHCHYPAGSSVTVVVDTQAGANRTSLTPVLTTATQPTQPSVQTQHTWDEHPPQPSRPESISYVQSIANAILASPQKRATLSQIYDWLVTNVAAFKGQEGSPSSVGWKNAVRHTLSTRPFFKRVICEESCGRQKPAWWTVDVEAMTLATSLRQHQQSQRRRKHGHNGVREIPSTAPYIPAMAHPATSVIRRASAETSTLERRVSDPIKSMMPVGEEEVGWSSSVLADTIGSPETAAVFRFPSTTILPTCKPEIREISPQRDILKIERAFDPAVPSDVIRGAIFESATGLEPDVFDCLLNVVTSSIASGSSADILHPRDALIFVLLSLRCHSLLVEYMRRSKSSGQLKTVFFRWLTLLSSEMSHLIVWPSTDSTRLPPAYLTDRLVAVERMTTVERVVGVLDVFTLEMKVNETDQCCRKTVNCVVVYNFDGAVMYRSKLCWLDCINHVGSFQSGIRSMIEHCVEQDLKEKLNGSKVLLTYLKMDDVLPGSIHHVQSRTVRNLLREKFADRLAQFEILSKPITLKRKGSRGTTTLACLNDILTVCSGLLNLSRPIHWNYDDR